MVTIKEGLSGGARVALTDTGWATVDLTNGALIKLGCAVIVGKASTLPPVSQASGTLISPTGDNPVRWIDSPADAGNNLYIMSANDTGYIYVVN